MNIIDSLTSKISEEKDTEVHWGGAMALWDTCRNKVIGIPVLEMFYDNAENPELKKLIRKGIDYIAVPHIEKLQKALIESKLAYPPLPQRKGIDDEQIARAIAEVLRLSIDLDYQAFLIATNEDIRNIIWEVANEDKKAFDEIMSLTRQEGWMLNPPNIQ